MSYGMTYHQYWDGDVYAHKQYRLAHKQRISDQNLIAWLQGRYVYDALFAMAPILRAFSKARKPGDYTPEPYPMDDNQVQRKQDDADRERYERVKEKVAAFATAFNEQRNAKGKEEDDAGSSTGN